MQPGRQLYSQGADGVHCGRDKLRYAGGTPWHSPDQPKLLLPEAEDCAADHEAETGED